MWRATLLALGLVVAACGGGGGGTAAPTTPGAVEGAREVHLTVTDGQVAALGDSGATYAARLTREISDGAVTVSDTGYLTLTFARSGAAWEIVAEHYSYRAGP